eukprot:746839-Hanusia_phi.AAC.10
MPLLRKVWPSDDWPSTEIRKIHQRKEEREERTRKTRRKRRYGCTGKSPCYAYLRASKLSFLLHSQTDSAGLTLCL